MTVGVVPVELVELQGAVAEGKAVHGIIGSLAGDLLADRAVGASLAQ